MLPSRRSQSIIMMSALLLLAIAAWSNYIQLSANAQPGHRLWDNLEHGNTNDYGGKRGAVASECAVCSRVGIDLLEKGGSAADSLVGTTFCIGVIAMYHGGIGGGGFMLVRGPDGGYEFVDFRETAPAAAFEDMYQGNENGSLYGGLASGVPGELRGLEYVHKRYGRLTWKEVVMPSVHLARDGFIITRDLANAMQKGTFFVDDPAWSVDFAPNGTLLQLGDTITRKRYATTLESIANDGPGVFYEGHIAETTIAAVRASNGTMTVQDLRNYTVEIREPLEIKYRDYRITAGGAPSGGPVALSSLKIVEGYEDFSRDINSNLSVHRLDEAFRFAYGQRTNIGDPSFVSGMTTYEQNMLNDTTTKHIRSLISDDHTLNISDYNPDGLGIAPTPGTAQIVTTDAQGMAITLTTTVNGFWGSHIMVPETGIIMNNEMNDFSIPNTTNLFGFKPSPANFVAPGKRPLSSVTTIIVEFLANSTLCLAIGAAGGSRIITSTVESLLSIINGGTTAAEALAKPRFHDQLVPNQMMFDWTYDNSTVAAMQSRGHNVTWVSPGFALVQAIKRLPNGTFDAASDPNLAAGGAFSL